MGLARAAGGCVCFHHYESGCAWRLTRHKTVTAKDTSGDAVHRYGSANTEFLSEREFTAAFNPLGKQVAAIKLVEPRPMRKGQSCMEPYRTALGFAESQQYRS